MREPDFCEGQLQQMANAELSNLLRGLGLLHPFPRIIPPHWEDLWGWDTGFFLPWLGPEHMEQLGCNFFIQYKLSKVYISRGAYGWASWQRSFFRFNLGYSRNRQWDFKQRDHLVALADEGFTVVYVTNHVLTFAELSRIAHRDQLCSSLPVLRVRNSLTQHERVSFTSESKYFCLHSEEEQSKRETIDSAISEIRASSLADDIGIILRILMRYEETAGIREGTVQQTIDKLKTLDMRHTRLRVAWWFLRRYLNVYWVRFAGNERKAEG